jgi:parallel beta-helix repeat protein
MRRISVLTGFFSLLLLLVMLGALFVTPIAANPEIRMVPTAQYPTIQAAINAANPGDIIQVASGIYYEHVVVNKSLTLIGESSSTTIIDGNGTGIVIRINAPDVEVRGFTVQNAGELMGRCILLGSCIGNTISDNILRKSAYGIEVYESNSCIIDCNKIMNNSWAGIYVVNSSNNVIHYNMIANNSCGAYIATASSLLNTFYHNNFINNLVQAQSFAPTTKWDNGAEGNYWSSYKGMDLNGDGIGDTALPYSEGRGADDYYPLIEPWSPTRRFEAGTWNGVTYYVTTFSNSTVASFNFSQPLKQISFNITSGASGFCNITIPIELLDGNFTIKLDHEEVSAPLITQNSTYSFIYFTYSNGTHPVEVYGTTVIVPEFSWSIFTSMFLVALSILLVFVRRRSKVFK